MSLRDLFINLGVNIEGAEKLAKVDKDIKGLTGTVRGFGAAWLSASAIRGAVSLFEQIVQGADALKHQAEMLGLSTKELQNYQAVSQMMQVDARQTAVAFRFFNRAIGEAAFGTKSAVKVFGQLGVQIRGTDGQVKPTGELLAEVADKLALTKSSAERTALAMRLLGRGGAALLPVLSQGSAELRKMFQRLEDVGEGFDDAFIEKAHQVVTMSGLIARGWKTMASALGNEVLPWVLAYMDRQIKNIKVMIDYAKHTYAIKTGLVALGVVIAAGVAWWQRARLALLLTNPELLAMAAAFALIAAAVAVTYLAFDDFFTFLQGGGSIIGDQLDKLFGAGSADRIRAGILDAIDQLKSAFGFADDAGKSMAQTLADFFVRKLPGFIAGGVGLIMGFVGAIDTLITAVRDLANKARYLDPRNNFSDYGKIGAESDRLLREHDEREKIYQGLVDSVQGLTRGPGQTTQQEKDDADARRMNDELPQSRTAALNQIAARADLPPVNIEQHFHGQVEPKDVDGATRDGVRSGIKDSRQRARDAYDNVTQGTPDGLIDPLTTFSSPQ